MLYYVKIKTGDGSWYVPPSLAPFEAGLKKIPHSHPCLISPPQGGLVAISNQLFGIHYGIAIAMAIKNSSMAMSIAKTLLIVWYCNQKEWVFNFLKFFFFHFPFFFLSSNAKP